MGQGEVVPSAYIISASPAHPGHALGHREPLLEGDGFFLSGRHSLFVWVAVGSFLPSVHLPSFPRPLVSLVQQEETFRSYNLAPLLFPLRT